MGPGDDEEEYIYCIECGEVNRIDYIETNAECDVWKCRVCGTEFQTRSDDDEEEEWCR